MEQNLARFKLAAMCRVLNVSRSGYYAARKREPGRRSTEDLALREKIVSLHNGQRKIPGAVKTWKLLNASGTICGKHRVARLRKLDGIESQRKARFRVMRSHQQREPAAPDLVKRAFMVTAPNKVWVGDMTTIQTRQGWLHLAIVIDLYARRVVGWALGVTQAAGLPIAALRMAVAQRAPSAGLICHTDQGAVYGSASYRQVLTDHGLRASMSRAGNCHDNAVAESFFSNLKNELTHHQAYAERELAKRDIGSYIELYYNRQRLHQTLQYSTPAEYEARYQSA
jgi:transposase InsO family protein